MKFPRKQHLLLSVGEDAQNSSWLENPGTDIDSVIHSANNLKHLSSAGSLPVGWQGEPAVNKGTPIPTLSALILVEEAAEKRPHGIRLSRTVSSFL